MEPTFDGRTSNRRRIDAILINDQEIPESLLRTFASQGFAFDLIYTYKSNFDLVADLLAIGSMKSHLKHGMRSRTDSKPPPKRGRPPKDNWGRLSAVERHAAATYERMLRRGASKHSASQAAKYDYRTLDTWLNLPGRDTN